MAAPEFDFTLNSEDVQWFPNKDVPAEKDVKADLRRSSEEHYITITEDIVGISKEQLSSQNNNKILLRRIFLIFFAVLLSLQISILIVFIFLQAYSKTFTIAENVLLTFMSAVFLETLGGVIAMVKFAFSNDQEVQILTIMNNVITGFQKFKE